MPEAKIALLFDIDGTLIITDGAGAVSWKRAFDELYGVEADISSYSDTGMTDPVVARRTFLAVIGRDPTPTEFTRLIERRMYYLQESVQESAGYKVLPGVAELLPALIKQGYLLGLTTGNLEAAAHIKLHRAHLNHFFSFGGYGSDSSSRTELTKVAMKRARVVSGADIAPSQFLALGDTPSDVMAAHESGIECVGVASHKFSVTQLKAAGADYVLDSLVDRLPL